MGGVNKSFTHDSRTGHDVWRTRTPYHCARLDRDLWENAEEIPGNEIRRGRWTVGDRRRPFVTFTPLGKD